MHAKAWFSVIVSLVLLLAGCAGKGANLAREALKASENGEIAQAWRLLDSLKVVNPKYRMLDTTIGRLDTLVDERVASRIDSLIARSRWEDLRVALTTAAKYRPGSTAARKLTASALPSLIGELDKSLFIPSRFSDRLATVREYASAFGETTVRLHGEDAPLAAFSDSLPAIATGRIAGSIDSALEAIDSTAFVDSVTCEGAIGNTGAFLDSGLAAVRIIVGQEGTMPEGIAAANAKWQKLPTVVRNRTRAAMAQRVKRIAGPVIGTWAHYESSRFALAGILGFDRSEVYTIRANHAFSKSWSSKTYMRSGLDHLAHQIRGTWEVNYDDSCIVLSDDSCREIEDEYGNWSKWRDGCGFTCLSEVSVEKMREEGFRKE